MPQDSLLTDEYLEKAVERLMWDNIQLPTPPYQPGQQEIVDEYVTNLRAELLEEARRIRLKVRTAVGGNSDAGELTSTLHRVGQGPGIHGHREDSTRAVPRPHWWWNRHGRLHTV